MGKTDGDFVALLYHKETRDIVIVNDIFGRLPLYCYQTTDKLIVSRELRFIAHVMDRKRFDRMAVAQQLLIGYPLGKRTLLENIDRLPPATCIRISTARSRIHIAQVCRFSCESKSDGHASVKENARELTALFSRSCAARAVPIAQNVISLSGGFDSRAIAACFHKLGIPFRSRNFSRSCRKGGAGRTYSPTGRASVRCGLGTFAVGSSTSEKHIKAVADENGNEPSLHVFSPPLPRSNQDSLGFGPGFPFR